MPDSQATLSPQIKGRSVNDWAKRLSPSAIPVDPAVKSAAIHKLLSRTGNAHNVADILSNDPVLVLRLVSSANKTLMRSDNEIKSLPHAVSLLGFPQTERILRAATDYDSEQPTNVRALRQQLSISLHAAQQMLGFTTHISRWAEDEIYLATLLQRAPIWALWAQAPELMTSLVDAQLSHGAGNHFFWEQAQLGCSVQTLAATLSRQWHLPTLSQQSWFPSERGHHRQWILLSRIIPEQARLALETFPNLQRLVAHPAFGSALANRLADEADRNWYSHRTLRLQRILATCMARPLSTAISLSHQQAAATPYLSSTQHSAHLLLGYYHCCLPADKSLETAAPQADTENHNRESEPAESATQTIANLSILIEQLQQKPESFTSLPALLQQALDILARDLQLDRCSALLIHGPSRELRTAFSVGCKDYPALGQFRHRFQRGDLFNKLLQKSLSLHVQVDNYSKIATLLPATFKHATATNQFFMMSIFAANKPIGILYADCAISNQPLTPRQYQQFKQLCTAIGQCITERAR